MVSPYFLSPREKDTSGPQIPPVQVEEPPVLSLESLDGERKIFLDGVSGWTHLPGSTGLEMPPYDIIRSSVPGVPGSILGEVRAEERPVFLPLDAASPNFLQVTHRAMMSEIRNLVDPLLGQFYIVCENRRLKVIYTDGLEGSFGKDEFGLYWRKFGLKALAVQPFAESVAERSINFYTASAGRPFLGRAGGTNAPWGTRAITSSSVIGDDMAVYVESEAPVFPVVELVGPMDSFEGTVTRRAAAPGEKPWFVSVPNGVPEDSTLRLVTDPRAKSIRLDGELAAGRVARGSYLRPFYPGVNTMNVNAPGGNAKTRVSIFWRDLTRSLW